MGTVPVTYNKKANAKKILKRCLAEKQMTGLLDLELIWKGKFGKKVYE